MKKNVPIYLCIMFASSVVSTTYATIITNGSFEDSLVGWNTVGNGIGRLSGGLYQCANPADGLWQLCMGGGGAPAGSYIEQEIATNSGWTYQLSFYVGRGGTSGGLAIQADVFNASNVVISSKLAQAPGDNYYGGYFLDFTAVSSTSLVRFTDIFSAPIADALLDNVTLNVVSAPEPATVLLVGLGGIGLLRRRRA
jgi:hypothetical protein